MRRLKWRLARYNLFEKIVFFTGIGCTVGVFALALLQLLGVIRSSSLLYLPLTALMMLTQAFENRKKKRKLAIFSLCAGIFVGICWVLILII